MIRGWIMDSSSKELILQIMAMSFLLIPFWAIRTPPMIITSVIRLGWLFTLSLPIVTGIYLGFISKTNKSAVYVCLATSSIVSVLIAARWWRVAAFEPGFDFIGLVVTYLPTIFGLMALGLLSAYTIQRFQSSQ